MTGDDHGSGETSTVFDGLMEKDPGWAAQELADWQCVRATSYAYPSSPIDRRAGRRRTRRSASRSPCTSRSRSTCADFDAPPHRSTSN